MSGDGVSAGEVVRWGRCGLWGGWGPTGWTERQGFAPERGGHEAEPPERGKVDRVGPGHAPGERVGAATKVVRLDGPRVPIDEPVVGHATARRDLTLPPPIDGGGRGRKDLDHERGRAFPAALPEDGKPLGVQIDEVGLDDRDLAGALAAIAEA